MNAHELERQATELGLHLPMDAPAPRLIRAIQRRRGQAACFGNDERFTCTDYACEWRAECLKPIAEWLRC